MKSDRRGFLKKSLVALAGVGAGLPARSELHSTVGTSATQTSTSFPIHVFSKHLQWLHYQEIANAAKEIGFDGVDITVRPGGHVAPERVATELPLAVENVKKAGLQVHMITTAIKSAEEPYAEAILKTAGALGIPYYRMGWIGYDSAISMAENENEIRLQLSRLAEINKTYNLCGDYQNHSGSNFGSPVWDLARALKGLDPKWIGSQYDILHATVEGANSWPLGLQALQSYIHTLDVKDFIWQKKDGTWKTELVPLGEGMVDFKKYFALLKKFNLRGPISMHFEYPLGGAENGARTITIPKDQVLSAMKRDLQTLRRLLSEAGLG